jgi:hypothetical protein
MEYLPYLYEGHRITVRAMKIPGGRWRGLAKIEIMPPTVEINPLEIFQGLTFNTEGQAYRETKKLAERQINELFLTASGRNNEGWSEEVQSHDE